MPADTPHLELLERLAATWPAEWQNWQSNSEHPLRGEMAALKEGDGAHLPFFRGSKVAWLTVASDASTLRRAIAGVKAWVIPSFAWEDRARPIVHPADYHGPLAGALSRVAPAGYYRWHSTTSAARSKIVDKLTRWRKLAALRPPVSESRETSLFELREQFRLALSTSDRSLAVAAVSAIDSRQLDTAANTSFMRMRMRARFGMHEDIVRDPDLARLASLRIPEVVRIGIIEAFFEVYIRDLVQSEKTEEARAAFKTNVLPEIGSLLALARPGDGEGARWMLEQLFPTPTSEYIRGTDQERFQSAVQDGDWTRVQEIGKRLIGTEDFREFQEIVKSGLANSLKHQPKPQIERVLRGTDNQIPVRTWGEFLSAIREGSIAQAEPFLESDERQNLDLSKPSTTHQVISEMADLLTQPASAMERSLAIILERSISFLIEDLVGDRYYPRCELADSYFLLLQSWVAFRQSSALPADSNVTLSLAQGIFECPLNRETEVAELLRVWWAARPVKANLLFLLSALELISEFCSQPTIGQGMWIDGITSIAARGVGLTPTEVALWQSIGRNLGFDQPTIDEYLPTVECPAPGEVDQDALAKAGLRKVAIVSLHERAAKAAGALLAERTGAQILIVDDLVAGPATESARTSDVILLVWAATKHAVYRAFDDVRDKLVYVQGTGMSSIVLALERWVEQIGQA